MTGDKLLFLGGAVALILFLQPASAQAPQPLPTEPFHYFEGFETGTDPVQFWTSYNKEYTVNFKGATTEKARSGKRCFKLDVTFKQASRFLWCIPLKQQPPVEGPFTFLGHMLLGEETTGMATLGVSFRFPPTRHSGCTRPYDFHKTTQGQWLTIGDDFSQRSKQIAGNIMSAYMIGVKGENVGVYLERIIFDLHGEAGQRVVLYVDDLEVTGDAPTEEAYQQEIARRWTPAVQAVKNRVRDWTAAIDQADAALEHLGELSPKAESLRRELVGQAKEARAAVAAVEQAGVLNMADPVKIDGILSGLANVSCIRALSDAERDGRAALIYVTPPISSTMILPQERLVPGDVSSEVSVVASRGEYEPASLVVSALEDLNALTVAVSDLQANDGIIPADCVDVRGVKCWYQAGTAWVGIRQDRSKKVLTPELLLYDDGLIKLDEDAQENYIKLHFPEGDKYEWISDPTEVNRGISVPVEKFPVRDSKVLLPVDIPEGRTKQFWLTVHVPDKAAPGDYAGTVTFRTADALVSKITLKLRVLPFELSAPYYTSSMDYHGRPASETGTIGSWIKSPAQFRAELANMVAHGLHNCQHYSIPKELLGQVLTIRREVGMDNRTLYLKSTIPIGNVTDPEALETIKRNVRGIIEFTKQFGTQTVYFYGMDERRGEALMSQRAAWKAVREAGGKIFVAGGGDNVETMADIQDMHVRAGRPDAEEVARWHALGHKIFCYANPQTGVENPVIYRRNYGLLLWKYDYDGASTNAYQHTFGMTWNDFDHRTYRAHTIAYPTVDGVVDTIAWEGYREGVDDVRYVTTLQKAIEAARQSGDAPRQARAQAAAEFLRQLKSGARIETGDLDEIRKEIIAHILEVG